MRAQTHAETQPENNEILEAKQNPETEGYPPQTQHPWVACQMSTTQVACETASASFLILERAKLFRTLLDLPIAVAFKSR